jgi:hypothetical protein
VDGGDAAAADGLPYRVGEWATFPAGMVSKPPNGLKKGFAVLPEGMLGGGYVA